MESFNNIKAVSISENETEILTFTAEEKDNGTRLDVFVSTKTEKTRSFVQKLLDGGLITVNGKFQKKNYKLTPHELVSVCLPQPEKTEIIPENISLNIVYEDEHLLVVDKPKGMVVHPAPGNPSGTLVNALMYHCGESLSGINGYIRPGIVHRIDKDTSGLLIVAKSDDAHKGLAEQIATHSFTRMYEAVVCGNVKEDKFRIELPIGRHPTDRKKMAVVFENSRNAITDVEVIWRYHTKFGSFTHVRMYLYTGRTHQIRVHMAHMGHPVLGDEVYGVPSKHFKLKGQCLLAKYISFVHPIQNKTLSFMAEMPEYFTGVIDNLKKTTIK